MLSALVRSQSLKSRASWLAPLWLAVGVLGVAEMTACTAKKPTGQVVAVVNGQEITTHDLDAEARADGARNGGANTTEMLRRVVARTLLAQSAHNMGLDKDPSYPSDRRRVDETMLAQRELQKSIRPDQNVTPAQIDQFVASEPLMFRNRQHVTVEQVQFQTTAPQNTIENFDTMPALLQWLQTGKIQAQKSAQTVDTAAVPPAAAAKLTQAPIGKLFLERQGDVVVGAVVTGREPVSVNPADQSALATQMLKRQRLSEAIDREVVRLKTAGKVSYQTGYAPKAGA